MKETKKKHENDNRDSSLSDIKNICNCHDVFFFQSPFKLWWS